MSTFNDLASELQIAIWQFVLAYRGIHWVQIEGVVHDAPYVRDGIRCTRHTYPDGETPEATLNGFLSFPECKEYRARFLETGRCPGLFFEKLVPVVPSVWGAAGPGDDLSDGAMAGCLAKEMEYTRRCRQLSSYTQVSAVLATCRLSRQIALEHVERCFPNLWHIYRGKGPLHRPRPLHAWGAQYSNSSSKGPDYGPPHTRLTPTIRSPVDLVVLRLHDSQGHATPMLRQAAFQFPSESITEVGSFPWLDRVGIEWHPRWAEERGQFCWPNIRALMLLMDAQSPMSTMLYWLVEDVARVNWEHDYPRAVHRAFNTWMASFNWQFLRYQTNTDEGTEAGFATYCDLDLEFEANGRRYYVVFVVIP